MELLEFWCIQSPPSVIPKWGSTCLASHTTQLRVSILTQSLGLPAPQDLHVFLLCLFCFQSFRFLIKHPHWKPSPAPSLCLPRVLSAAEVGEANAERASLLLTHFLSIKLKCRCFTDENRLCPCREALLSVCTFRKESGRFQSSVSVQEPIGNKQPLISCSHIVYFWDCVLRNTFLPSLQTISVPLPTLLEIHDLSYITCYWVHTCSLLSSYTVSCVDVFRDFGTINWRALLWGGPPLSLPAFLSCRQFFV